MKKEHPDWNFCPTCNASLREAKKTEIFALFLTHSDSKFVISISLSPEDGTGVVSPFSMDGGSKFPVWAEPAQLGSVGLARERLFEEAIVQHVLPAFRNGFKIARFNANESDMQIFADVFMRFAQRDLAEQSLRHTLDAPSEIRGAADPALPLGRTKNFDASPLFDAKAQLPSIRTTSTLSSGENESENGFRTPNMTSTGVSGFDRITNGGVPKSKITLISGPSGLGKTIFGIQFLIEGAKKLERGVLALADHSPLDVIQEAEILGLPLLKLLGEKKIFLVVLDASRSYDAKGVTIYNTRNEQAFFHTLEEIVRKTKAKRAVLDSLTSLIARDDPLSARRKIIHISESLERLHATVLATGYVASGSKSLTFLGLEENFVSGLVSMRSTSIGGNIVRYLFVPKMKGTDHNLQKFVYDIEPRSGIRVLDPVKHHIERTREGSNETIRDALQIANVLRSLAISNFGSVDISGRSLEQLKSFPNLNSTSAPFSETIPSNGLSGVSYPQRKASPAMKGQSQSSELKAHFKSNTPSKPELKEAKMPSSALQNPWMDILAARKEDANDQGQTNSANSKDASEPENSSAPSARGGEKSSTNT
jgi:KaiC/GvpD/RAD55 family RecA-like ATPase